MRNKLFLLVAGLMVTTLIFGCSTDDPWQPDPGAELTLSLVSGPDGVVIDYGSSISYSWTSGGGVGEVTYRYQLTSGDWSEWSNSTSASFDNVIADDTFEVMARDSDGEVGPATASFTVGPESGADTTPPSAWITVSPIEGSFVASGTAVTFSWDGNDDVDMDNVTFMYSFAGYTSELTPARTVTFADVQNEVDATFEVWCYDQSGNMSDPTDTMYVSSVSFTIKDATILYVDDFQWYDVNGNIDMVKERDQKQFYRDALEGFAFAEWDIAVQGFPDSAMFVSGGTPVFSTVLFASDSDVGTEDGTWWTQIGATDNNNSLHYYMESGGNLIASGVWILPDIWWTSNPPVTTDFEYKFLGVSDEASGIIDGVDSLWWFGGESFPEHIEFFDSLTADTTYFDFAWDYHGSGHFTWAISDESSTLDLPDSMKIDVAKNGDQEDYANVVLSLRNDPEVQTNVLFNWGLDVNVNSPGAPYYMNPIGYICRLSSTDQWTAVMHFDTYAMPLPAMKQTFAAILTQFGE